MMCSQHQLVILFLYCSTLVWCHVPFPQPGFLSDPVNLEGELNETIVIPCVVHDLDSNVLKWWKDNDLLFDSSDDSLMAPPRYTILHNYMLMVDWLEPSDAGNYTCEIVRPYPRHSLEQIHTVRVRHSPKIVTIPGDGQVEALLGAEVQMGCMASGWPIPTVTWRFKNKVMKSVDNRHKLIFTAEDPQQAGVYDCEADNQVGKPAMGSILLKIYYAPKITVEKTWVHSSVGMRTEFYCELTGEPPPRVEWFFNGEPLRRGSTRVAYRVRGNKHFLSFRNVQDNDFGEYTCRGTNKVGQAEKTIQLSGLAYPAVFKNTRGLVSPDSYSLIWEVESYSPIIEYKLFFREANENEWIQLIIPADPNAHGPLHSKSYTLSGMKLSTVYQARLISRNRFGWSEPSEMIQFASEGVDETGENDVSPVSGSITSGVTKTPENLILIVLSSFILTLIKPSP